MKKLFLYNIAWIMAALSVTGCVDPDDLVTENAREGGQLTTDVTSIIYSQGLPKEYTLNFEMYQGKVYVKEINIYKSFYSSVTGETTNESLLVTIPVPVKTGTTSVTSPGFDFDDLAADLILDGDPFPSDDSGLEVGDYWELRVESVTSTGGRASQIFSPRLVVSGRYAGTYRVVSTEYYRISVPRPDVVWPTTMTMESVNTTTYRQVGYFGPFAGGQLFWTIDGDLDIDYPASVGGVAQNSGGQPLITCLSDPGNMTNVHCATSNFAVNDNVEGKDVLTMSYGYLVAGSGPREMYQVLEKIVD